MKRDAMASVPTVISSIPGGETVAGRRARPRRGVEGRLATREVRRGAAGFWDPVAV